MRIEESTKGINRNAINIGVVFFWTANTENKSNREYHKRKQISVHPIFPKTWTHDKGMNGTKNITDIWDGHFLSSNLKCTLNPKKNHLQIYIVFVDF